MSSRRASLCSLDNSTFEIVNSYHNYSRPQTTVYLDSTFDSIGNASFLQEPRARSELRGVGLNVSQNIAKDFIADEILRKNVNYERVPRSRTITTLSNRTLVDNRNTILPSQATNNNVDENVSRTAITNKLKQLAAQHLLVQEKILNNMKRLNERNKKLEEQVQESQEKIMNNFKKAQEILQKQMQESQKALMEEAEKRKKQIHQQLESMNELSQEKNAEFIQEQQKILKNYTKYMQRRK